MFLGFIEPTSGSAQIEGLEVKDHPLQTKRALAYIPENVMLYPNLTGLENLEYFTTLAGCDAAPALMRETLQHAGLPDEAVERRVGTYSKGMRQKVGIAMAIAREARVLLLDEPTSSLDQTTEGAVLDAIDAELDDDTILVMVTHKFQLLSRFTDTAVVIRYDDSPLARELYPTHSWKWTGVTSLNQANNAITEVWITQRAS